MAGSFMTQPKQGIQISPKWRGQREVVKTRKFMRNGIFWPFLENAVGPAKQKNSLYFSSLNVKIVLKLKHMMKKITV
jgi:hypothetical protein